MAFGLTPEQRETQAAFRAFVNENIAPFADQWDRDQALPPELFQALGGRRYMVPSLPAEYGGLGMSMLEYGLFSEEVGRGCSSVRNLLGVQGMVAHAVLRFGSTAQKQAWLPRVASGETVAAFALTEPGIGSDAKNVAANATASANGYVLNGVKKWISFGMKAGIFLVIARAPNGAAAFLVEKGTPGFTAVPILDLLGLRASMLGELHFNNCEIPAENRVGKEGFGFAWVANTALDYGRFSTASGCVGVAQACLDASHRYSSERTQFGVPIREHQLIRQMLTNMRANTQAARLLCYQAGDMRDQGAPEAIQSTLLAKYFASSTLSRSAADAVQIHGANGIGYGYSVQRYFRDAKIMEIIEGTTQIQQVLIE
jgi:alkylation response protein AidB-like acyl-CoA dehydrogenase